MTGFINDFVNEIAINLRDRYKTGFPILKELVQNADDAGAKSVAFGYHTGHDAADHMLLKGPALWVLNDGKFKSSDKQAILSFGLSAKAGDSGVIGKFGLGMKSVFHLCEGFFYIAGHDGRLTCDFLNPWRVSSYQCSEMHQQWETVTLKDEMCLEAVARSQPEVSSERDWFLLWVPLRKRSHVPRDSQRPTAPIIARFPGDGQTDDLDFFSDPDTDQRIAGLLPLLRNLDQVRFAGADMRESFLVALKSTPPERRLDHRTDGIQICGVVSDDRQRSGDMQFLVRQRVPALDQPFNSLRGASTWPMSMVSTELGTREPRPDKAFVESAVMFSHADKRVGRLDLQWAVFLPAEEQRFRYEAQIPESSREYRMVLHGQFFVDAGRRGIADMDALHEAYDALPENAAQHLVLRQWNQALAQEVVLPEILPALSEYVKFATLKNDEIAALTASIANCSAAGDGGSKISFFMNFQQFICKRFSWILRLKRRGRDWSLVDANEEQILCIPVTPPGDPERPWRTLPGLATLTGYAFAAAGAPSLSNGEATWRPELLLVALKDIDLDILKNEVDLDYFASFLELEAAKFVKASDVQDALVNILRKGLLRVSLTEVRKNRKIFKRIVQMLSPDRIFAFGPKDHHAKGAIPEAIYRVLLNTATKALAVPGDLGPDGVTTGPSDEDLIAWLVALDRHDSATSKHGDVNISQFLDTAELVIRASGDDERQLTLLRKCRRLRVLRAVKSADAAVVAVSLEDLVDSHGQGWLFRVGYGDSPLGSTSTLARALPEIQVLVVRATVASYVSGLLNLNLSSIPRSDDVTALLRVAGAQLTPILLGDVTCRAMLLALVANAKLDDPLVVRGVRYLLHGSVEHYLDNDSLWKDPVGQKSPWVRLWKMVHESPWQILADTLCSSIPDKCAQALNIKAVDEVSVLKRLTVCQDFSRVDSAQFTDEEIDLILGRVVEARPWQLLPLHRDFNGNRAALDNECFLEQNPALPTGFDHTVRFIQPSTAPDHLRQQQKLLRTWNAKTAATIVLASKNAGQYWSYLMDLLKVDPYFVDENFRGWYEVEWLPLINKRFIALNSLIYIKNLNGEIRDLARCCDYAYATPDDLVSELQDHPAFYLMKAQVSSGEEALPVLGQLMSEANLSIGASALLCYRDLQKHMSTLASIDLLPAWGLIERATVATSFDAVEKHLIPEVTKQISFEVCEKVLNRIPDLAGPNLVNAVFCLYLREWRNCTIELTLKKKGLGRLKLLSKAAIWVPAAELVAGVNGLMPEFVIDDRQFEVLGDLAVDNRSTPNLDSSASRDSDGEAVGQELFKALEVYFEPLISSGVKPYVGAVTGLFGETVIPLAKTWLEPIGYDDYLTKLGWQDPGYEDSGERRVKWMGNKTVDQALSTLKIRLEILNGSHVSARSLTGASVQVRLALENEIETLFIRPNWEGGYRCTVIMRPVIGMLDKEAKQQREILIRTAEGLLKDLYNQQQANLSELSALAGEADQITLDVARTLILEGLPQSLRSLPGILKNNKLAQALADLDGRRRDLASARRAGRARLDGATDNLEAARAALAELVESDKEVQNAVLGGIKGRVAHNQYEVSSIPFEIFQNADDAVSEMQLIQKTDDRPEFDSISIGQLWVQSSDKTIRLVHWGRPINYAGRVENRRPDFANDLERMLMLGASAKDENEGVTGKFGLGFKSVFLASSNPRVWSGDLCFEVLAGCLPGKWRASSAIKQFYQVVQTPDKRGLRPTIIELSLNSEVGVSEVMVRFAGLAGLLPVFAHKLRCVVVDDKSHSWQPRSLRLKGSELIEVGSVSIPVAGGWVQSRILVFRVASGSAVLRIGSDGIEEFDRNAQPVVPGIWVTAPTRGAPARGVLLNASFQIDTGRATLAMGRSKEINTALTRSLAKEVSRGLIELQIDSEANWLATAAQLGCSPSVSVAGFWYSLWDVLLSDTPGQDSAIDAVLLDMFACALFCNVVKETGRVPNGLRDESAALVDVEKVRLSINVSYLASAVPTLRNWSQFTDKYPIDCWCTKTVFDWLVRAGVIDDGSLPSIGVAEVVSVLTDGRLLSTAVSCLAAVLRAWPSNLGEDLQWRQKLEPILLQSAAGTWEQARLLIRGDGPELELVKRFAPKEVLLHPDYELASKEFQFVDEYLLPWHADPSSLAVWCLAAYEDDARTAVAEWLVRNIYEPIIYVLRPQRDLGGWLFELTVESPFLLGLSSEERGLLITKLQLIAVPPPPFSSNLDLESIYDWWSNRGSYWLSEYDKRLWPSSFDRQALTAEPYDRSAWMTLFSMGLFRRYGRVTDQQHRGFLDFLSRKGWWDTICKVQPEEGAEAWMNILREYGEAQQLDTLYEQWMDSFPRMYRIARWLDTYVHLFQTLDLRDSVLAKFLLSPASDTSLSGSGLEAPTLSGMLRLGQHLVIRELLRLGVLKSDIARQQAFAPQSAVLDLMHRLGYDGLSSSNDIYDALEGALGQDKFCFEGAFDIPLQLIISNAKACGEAEDWAQYGCLMGSGDSSEQEDNLDD